MKAGTSRPPRTPRPSSPAPSPTSAPSPRTTPTCARPRTSSSSQRNLNEIEDEIQASRRIYNSNVQAYNTKIQIFPNSLVANSGGFTAREFFEIENAAEREPVEVKF